MMVVLEGRHSQDSKNHNEKPVEETENKIIGDILMPRLYITVLPLLDIIIYCTCVLQMHVVTIKNLQQYSSGHYKPVKIR